MNFKGPFKSMFIVILLFSGSMFLFMLIAVIDGVFFEEELFNLLRTKYHKQSTGALMIFIVLGGLLMMYFGTRQNKQVQDAFEAAMLKTQETTKETEPTKSGFSSQADAFSSADPEFKKLNDRFESYLKSSNGELGSRFQALDIYGVSQGMIGVIYSFTYGIFALMVAVFTTMYYIKSNYGLSFGDALAASRESNPMAFFPVVLFTALFALLFIGNYLKDMAEHVFGFAWSKMPGQTVNEQKITYQNFFLQKVQVEQVNWRRIIFKGVLACFYIPFISGILLLNSQLFLVGAICIGFSIFMLLKDKGKGDVFQVSEKGWIRLMPWWGRTVDFSMADCKVVVVRYVSNQSRSVRISGTSATVADIGRMVTNRLLNLPEFIPSSIAFHLKNKEPIVLPLRFLGIEKGVLLHSHAVEFYFAFLLKSFGFQFEVPENEELAGDWRAVNQGLLS